MNNTHNDQMVYIENTSVNPYFNIAVEEYLLSNFAGDCMMLYRNEPSVIVGKHQNTLAEIHYSFVTKNNIKVIRRISGGGAVFHDLGNINFLFIRNGEEGKLVNFELFTNPILEALRKIGVNAEKGDKNDLLVNKKKISGNAEHIFKNRVLHHGTLLFKTDLSKLRDALDTKVKKYTDRSIKSNPGSVMNISDLMSYQLSEKDFIKFLKEFLIQYFNADTYQLSPIDLININRLADEKYSAWNWNFGYSPAYKFKNEIHIGQYSIKVRIAVESGIIKQIEFINDNIETTFFRTVEHELIGMQHREENIRDKMKLLISGQFLPGMSLDDFILQLF